MKIIYIYNINLYYKIYYIIYIYGKTELNLKITTK